MVLSSGDLHHIVYVHRGEGPIKRWDRSDPDPFDARGERWVATSPRSRTSYRDQRTYGRLVPHTGSGSRGPRWPGQSS